MNAKKPFKAEVLPSGQHPMESINTVSNRKQLSSNNHIISFHRFWGKLNIIYKNTTERSEIMEDDYADR